MGWWDHAERCSASTQSLQPQEATQTPSCIAQICAGTAGTKEWDMGGRQRQSLQASTAHFVLLLQHPGAHTQAVPAAPARPVPPMAGGC